MPICHYQILFVTLHANMFFLVKTPTKHYAYKATHTNESMKQYMNRYKQVIAACIILFAQTVTAQQIILTDSAQVSLLTCTPGTETYSKYGHSAIRVQDVAQQIDWTFNYGVFNFNTKNFYLKFMRGYTWYELDVEDTDWFVYTSSLIGRTTYEQVLNLTQNEKQALLDALIKNYEPQNRHYLYNFVFDNCATRPYRLLKKIVPDLETATQNNRLPFEDTESPTFRQLIHHYSEQNSWAGFGIDFVFGSVADQPTSTEQRLFLPEQLMRLVGTSTLSDGRQLCTDDNTAPFIIASHSWVKSPYMALLIVALLMAVITGIDIKRHQVSWWFDATLWVAGGLLGTISFYLSCFSIHPLVQHNWNLLLVNPLLFAPAIAVCFSKGRQWMQTHAGITGICCIVLIFLTRLICLRYQAWHWLLLLPALHYLRLIMIGRKELRHIYGTGYLRHKKAAVCILTLMTATTISAEPRLTVVICVDGLNKQALTEMRGYWQQGGLRTLDEEAHESTLSFPQLVYGGSETLATIVSGTTPDNHGITADNYFDRKERKVKNIFTDETEKGIGTHRHLSPKALLSPTITDLFRMSHTDRSKVYAIGIHPENTLLLAGHAANACAWLEEKDLCWATTGYYSEGLPATADEMNIKGRIAELVSQTWTPRMDAATYMHPTTAEKKKGFNYNQKDVLRQSPAANTLVIELALELQKKAVLGTDSQADMLLLELTVNSPKAQSDLLETAEQEDMYIRLNQDLGWLMEQLTKRIGKDHYRLLLFGKPELGCGNNALAKANLQTHFFNTERAAALCNTYLMAIYGHERWVDGGYGNCIYLNKTLIEQKKIRLSDIQRQVAGFLLEFEGTKSAFATTDLMLVPNGGEEEKLRLSLNKHTAGDIVFCLQPLWLIGEENKSVVDQVADANPMSPLMLWTTELNGIPEKTLSATEVKDILLK